MKYFTDREQKLFSAAVRQAHSRKHIDHSEPREPSIVEQRLLRAIEAFRAGRQTRGWDLIDLAELGAVRRAARERRK